MIRLYFLSLLLSLSSIAWAQEVAQNSPEQAEAGDTLTTLQKFTKLRSTLETQIKEIERQLRSSPSDSDKKELQKDLVELQGELDSLKENFVEIAAGTSFFAISSKQEQDFNLQDEMLSLMEPVIREMKYMTSEVRKKSDIREEITFYTTRIPKAKGAIVNVSALIAKAKDEALKEYLQDILDDLKRHLANMESQLQALELQLSRIESAETSFTDASHTYLKSFFQKRGLYLTQALLVVFVILILSRLTHALMRRLVPGYRMEHRRSSSLMLNLRCSMR